MTSAWEYMRQRRLQKRNKTAILIPHQGEVSSEWALRLRELIVPEGSQTMFARGMPIDVARNTLVQEALKRDFEWIFFLDSDIICPPDTLLTLLSHRLPLISGLYRAKKRGGFSWAAWNEGKNEEGKRVLLPMESWTGRLVQVDFVGMGCCLIHRDVFKMIRKRTELPFFLWTKDRSDYELDRIGVPDDMRGLSEDFYFCKLAKKYGNFSVVVDTKVKTGHIGIFKAIEEGVSLPDL